MIKNTMSFIPLLADVAWSCNGTSDTSLDLGINFDGLSEVLMHLFNESVYLSCLF